MTAVKNLIEHLAKLPGLGPRSAKRIALHLVTQPRQVLSPLIDGMQRALNTMKVCEICFNIDENSPCDICQDPQRNQHSLCILADVGDLWTLERTKIFKGHYHVLGGLLSAVDGIGPTQLSLSSLIQRLSQGVYTEVIFALNATIDAQTTMHYIINYLQHFSLTFTTLARGMPLGGELNYLDEGTLSIAFQHRSHV